MLIELLEMFLGAFNYFFSPEDVNYTYFSEILCVVILLSVLITCCLAFLTVLRQIFHIAFKGGR